MATMAGSGIALDARDALAELRPDLAVVDCMLPAAIAAARATGTPPASLVHFLYGLARTQMLRAGGGWTTDLRTLAATHRMLGLTVATDGLSAWEAPDLVLVSAPRWLDIDCEAPANVLHAGPLGVGHHPPQPAPTRARPMVLLTFSTTVMGGQTQLIDRVCEAVADLDVDALLTLGGVVERDAVRVPDSIEVMAFGDHDRIMPACAAVVGPRRTGNGASRTRPRCASAAAATGTRPGIQREPCRTARRRDRTPHGCAARAHTTRPARITDGVAIFGCGDRRRPPDRRPRTRPNGRRGTRTRRP